MKDELFWAGVTGQADAVASGEVSSRELVTAVLERIQRYDGALFLAINEVAQPDRAEQQSP